VRLVKINQARLATPADHDVPGDDVVVRDSTPRDCQGGLQQAHHDPARLENGQITDDILQGGALQPVHRQHACAGCFAKPAYRRHAWNAFAAPEQVSFGRTGGNLRVKVGKVRLERYLVRGIAMEIRPDRRIVNALVIYGWPAYRE
jgi:hypothetical protein